jgi:hypothetical protein
MCLADPSSALGKISRFLLCFFLEQSRQYHSLSGIFLMRRWQQCKWNAPSQQSHINMRHGSSKDPQLSHANKGLLSLSSWENVADELLHSDFSIGIISLLSMDMQSSHDVNSVNGFVALVSDDELFVASFVLSLI